MSRLLSRIRSIGDHDQTGQLTMKGAWIIAHAARGLSEQGFVLCCAQPD
jgi:hypothetical protein